MLNLLERAMCGDIDDRLPAQMKQMFEHYFQRKFDLSEQAAKQLYDREDFRKEKPFLLHFLCACVENRYDLRARHRWMAEWHSTIIEQPNEFSFAAHRYHQAVGLFFQSQYGEAQRCFSKVAENSEAPVRFRALARFHLGLIHRDRRIYALALKHFELALELANHISHTNLILRIKRQLDICSNGVRFPLFDPELVDLIFSRDLKALRKRYLEMRREEREAKVARGHRELHALIPAIMLLRGDDHRAIKMLKHVLDPSIKLQAVELLKALGDNSEGLALLEGYLKTEIQAEGIEAKFENRDLQEFLNILMQSESVTKEKICSSLWDFTYDPVIHDGRIYKLVHRLREHFGTKDIIINRYGSYELNRSRTS